MRKFKIIITNDEVVEDITVKEIDFYTLASVIKLNDFCIKNKLDLIRDYDENKFRIRAEGRIKTKLLQLIDENFVCSYKKYGLK